jgi:hypothetical protein
MFVNIGRKTFIKSTGNFRASILSIRKTYNENHKIDTNRSEKNAIIVKKVLCNFLIDCMNPHKFIKTKKIIKNKKANVMLNIIHEEPLII